MNDPGPKERGGSGLDEGPRLEQWHGRSVEAWRTAWGVPALHIFRSAGSTNDAARRLAEDGAPEGTTVIADAQTRGRGRRGRVWHADPGCSLILSMVVRPGARGVESVLSIRLGLATARAIEDTVPLAVGLKWPNDLLVDGLKVGGMLCEGAIEQGRPAFVVAGTGVNVLQPDDAWPDTLADRATSLAARAGLAVEMPALAGRVVARWLDVLDAPADTLSPDELDAFRSRDVLGDRPVTVEGDPAGVVQGLAADGALLLAHPEGRARRVVSGTVRLLQRDTGEPS
ncbi:MAG: biotin--[acetyl-CoA-carboxylase] ligase [Longimicrobiales bacterium]